MNSKTALIQEPITPDLRTQLESMGFEVVDMNDREAMKDFRRRLAIEDAMQRVNDAIGMRRVDVRQTMRRAEAEFESQEDQKQSFPSERPRELLPFLLKTVEPAPEVLIDKKKDNFSFLDFKYGRRGKARSQGFSKHFKHG